MKNQNQPKSACSDVKRTGNESLIALCLPSIILNVILRITGTDSISELPNNPEEIVDPDHPP